MQNIKINGIQQIINSINFNIYEHGHFFGGQDWNYLKVFCPFNRLYFVISGSGRFSNDTTSFEVSEGNIYLIPANNTYDLSCSGELEKFYIHFRMEVIPGRDIFADSKHISSISLDEYILKELLGNFYSKSINGALNCYGIFIKTIGHFITPYADMISSQIKTYSEMEEIFKYISSNLSGNLRVKEVARHFNINADYLSSKFSKSTGISMKKYIEQCIADQAKSKIALTDSSIKNIAYDLKFNDEFQFSHFFKRLTGLSPLEFRSKNRIETLKLHS